MNRHFEEKNAQMEANLRDYLNGHTTYYVLEILQKIVGEFPDKYAIDAAKLRSKKRESNAVTCDRLAENARQEVVAFKTIMSEWHSLKEGRTL